MPVAQAAEIKRLYSYQQKSGLWGFISLGSALSSAESNTFTNAYASIEGRQVWLHASGNRLDAHAFGMTPKARASGPCRV